MKITYIIPTCALLITPLALVSCGNKEDTDSGNSKEPTSATASASSHEDIGKGMVGVMTEMMTSMAEIEDAASAQTFADSVPGFKATMKDLLETANSLPAPTDEEKAAINKMMDDAKETVGPATMKTMMGLSQNPEGEAIREIMGKAMQDKEMDQVSDDLEALYKTEETEESGPE
ncbi:MAG: hypothetical protein AB8D78_06800 [Akkermansiaceae bacterium]